jgi:hypothetical protein
MEGKKAAAGGKAAAAVAERDADLRHLRWGDWMVTDVGLGLVSPGSGRVRYCVPLGRVHEGHWLANFSRQPGASPRDVANLALALADLRRW